MTKSEVIEKLAYIAHASNFINNDFFTIENDKYHDIINQLKKMNIGYEDLGDNSIQINSNLYTENDIKVYHSTRDFFENYEETDQTVVILGDKDNDSIVSYEENGDVFYQQHSNKTNNHTVTNFFYLKKIINLLSDETITDYKDTTHNRYFILTPECGKLDLNEGESEDLIEIAKNEVNLFNTYKIYLEMNDYKKGWEPILKNKIIQGLEGIDKEKEGFKKLIIDLPKYSVPLLQLGM